MEDAQTFLSGSQRTAQMPDCNRDIQKKTQPKHSAPGADLTVRCGKIVPGSILYAGHHGCNPGSGVLMVNREARTSAASLVGASQLLQETVMSEDCWAETSALVGSVDCRIMAPGVERENREVFTSFRSPTSFFRMNKAPHCATGRIPHPSLLGVISVKRQLVGSRPWASPRKLGLWSTMPIGYVSAFEK